jgi:hypothetical protein
MRLGCAVLLVALAASDALAQAAGRAPFDSGATASSVRGRGSGPVAAPTVYVRGDRASDARLTALASCSAHRTLSVVFGAVGGALAGWLTYQVAFGWGGENRSNALRAVFIGAGALIGVAQGVRHPMLPPRCRPGLLNRTRPHLPPSLFPGGELGE